MIPRNTSIISTLCHKKKTSKDKCQEKRFDPYCSPPIAPVEDLLNQDREFRSELEGSIRTYFPDFHQRHNTAAL